MKIIVAGKDLTEELTAKIKANLFCHLALQNLSAEELNLVEMPEEWRIEYQNSNQPANGLFPTIKPILYLKKFAPKLSLVPPAIKATAAFNASSEKEFLSFYLKLMQHREHIDTFSFYIPHNKSILSRFISILKIIFWHFAKFMFDRIAFRQNLINSYLSSAIEFEHKITIEELNELKEKVKELEEKIKEKPI